MIWAYVLGFQVVHIMEERARAGVRISHRGFFHTVCESPTTERDAYELARNANCDPTGPEDMTHGRNRHAACNSILRRRHEFNRVQVDILSVCRHTYQEAIRVLWSTNTWSILDWQSCRAWLGRRTALQRSLIRKIHLASDIVLAFLPRSLVFKFPLLKKLYIEITTNCRALKTRKSWSSYGDPNTH